MMVGVDVRWDLCPPRSITFLARDDEIDIVLDGVLFFNECSERGGEDGV